MTHLGPSEGLLGVVFPTQPREKQELTLIDLGMGGLLEASDFEDNLPLLTYSLIAPSDGR